MMVDPYQYMEKKSLSCKSIIIARCHNYLHINIYSSLPNPYIFYPMINIIYKLILYITYYGT